MEEALVKRVLPHSIEAEQSVIGAMLMDSDAIEAAAEMLREEDFYARQYGVLFSVILEMRGKGEAVDPVTLQARLREKDLPPEIYGSSAIFELIEQVPTSANIRTYAGIVAEKSLLRRMIRANEEIAGACYTQKDDVSEIMNQAEKKIFEISQQRDANGFVPIRQIVLNAIDKIEYASHIKGNVTGLATGFT
ncbi:MAG: replicative DNA helicase, partial [Lachnospiraceae bacterium]|nr:replicative DNA helicase [Lachnospiraceae bacterium]